MANDAATSIAKNFLDTLTLFALIAALPHWVQRKSFARSVFFHHLGGRPLAIGRPCYGKLCSEMRVGSLIKPLPIPSEFFAGA